MHKDRLSYLAYTYPVRRPVIGAERDGRGHWVISLDCGHQGGCVGHMDPSKSKEWSCAECSFENVLTSPRWAGEFEPNEAQSHRIARYSGRG